MIVVDDNSTDADSYLDKYPELSRPYLEFIRTTKGGGAGYARNVGLDYAKGKWLLFADSDDFFVKNAFNIVREYAYSDADVVYFKAESVFSDNPEEPSTRGRQQNSLIDGYLYNGEGNKLRVEYWSPWGKMIRSELVASHNIRFDEVKYSNDHYFSANVGLNAKKIKADSRVVYVVVYGKNEEAERLDEQAFGTLDPLDDRSCYPESKRAAESLLKSYYLQYGVNFNTIRIAHSYGPTMQLENDGRVMADLMGDVVTGRNIVLKSSGEAIRAFLYITDAVVGMFTVLFHGETAKAYNLANETEPISIKDLAQLLAASRMDKNIQVVVSESEQKGYCAYRRTALDTSAIEKLGWKPLIPLKEGVNRVFRYAMKNGNSKFCRKVWHP